VLQDDRDRVCTRPPECRIIIVMQRFACRIQRLDQAGYRLPLPCGPPRNASCAAAP